ncbi:MAG TPA: VWA domain-containing protein [Vicinamibacterales bacterium]|nr:VWA domain-containing protein [Vicinamibacterales bacterium]
MTTDLTFHRPELAWVLAGAVGVLLLHRVLRRRHYLGVSSTALFPRAVRASPLRHLPRLVLGGALIFLTAALMDPATPVAEQRVTERGVDIALVLDLSSSMEEVMSGGAVNAAPQSRLEVTKRAISAFIERRPSDRLGLVVFSDNAYVVSPLTSDHEPLQRYLASIDEQTLRMEGMTAIGEGIALADLLLRRQATHGTRNGVIVVFTDGEHNYGRDPVEALGEALDAGHRVHLIGVDLAAEVKQKEGVRRLVRAVERGGGRYFTADSRAELAEVSRAIDAVEAGTLVSSRLERNVPVYGWFAAAALLTLCCAVALAAVPAWIDLT